MDGLLSRCLGFKGLGDRPHWLPSSGGGDGALRLELSALDGTDLFGRAVRRGADSSLGIRPTAAAASSLKAILVTEEKPGGDHAGVVSLCRNMTVTRVARPPGSGDSRLFRRRTGTRAARLVRLSWARSLVLHQLSRRRRRPCQHQ